MNLFRGRESVEMGGCDLWLYRSNVHLIHLPETTWRLEWMSA